MIFEAQKYKAWTEGDAEYIIKEAQARLRQQGWDATRGALTTTVRAYIMRAFVENGMRGDVFTALKFYGWALEILDWGSVAWKNVPKDDRGAIFEPTFIRGVRCLHIEMLMQVSNQLQSVNTHGLTMAKGYSKDPGPNSKYPLESLLEEAELILKGIRDEQRSTEPADPGFISSFYVYPKAHALS